MGKSESVQESFLNSMRKSRTVIHVYLINGKRLQGKVEAFDNFVILLKVEDSTHMIYKHAISTVLPAQAMATHKRRSSSEEDADSEYSQISEDTVSPGYIDFRG